MSELEPKPELIPNKVTPARCLVGALVSGGIAFALYNLLLAIAVTFAEKPVQFTNQIAIQIAIAVRTLVVGIAALGTGVFSIVALGLILLAIQLSFQKLKAKQE